MKHTKLIRLGLAVSIAGFCAANLNAAQVDGTATANVLTPLTITETTAMNFGDIAGGTAAGTVVLPANGTARTVTGDAQAVTGGGETPATFTISGATGQAITVVLDATGAQLDDGAAGAAMALTALTNTGLPTAAGAAVTFDVGATLAVGASQAAGVYDTNLANGGVPYTVTVTYD